MNHESFSGTLNFLKFHLNLPGANELNDLYKKCNSICNGLDCLFGTYQLWNLPGANELKMYCSLYETSINCLLDKCTSVYVPS